MKKIIITINLILLIAGSLAAIIILPFGSSLPVIVGGVFLLLLLNILCYSIAVKAGLLLDPSTLPGADKGLSGIVTVLKKGVLVQVRVLGEDDIFGMIPSGFLPNAYTLGEVIPHSIDLHVFEFDEIDTNDGKRSLIGVDITATFDESDREKLFLFVRDFLIGKTPGQRVALLENKIEAATENVVQDTCRTLSEAQLLQLYEFDAEDITEKLPHKFPVWVESAIPTKRDPAVAERDRREAEERRVTAEIEAETLKITAGARAHEARLLANVEVSKANGLAQAEVKKEEGLLNANAKHTIALKNAGAGASAVAFSQLRNAGHVAIGVPIVEGD